MVAPEFPPQCGGIGYYVFYLTRELLAQGVQVKVLVRRKKNESIKYQEVEAESVAIAGLPPFNNNAFRQRIESTAADWGADLIHIHASSMPAPRSKQPVVVTSHSCIGSITPLFYRPIRDLESFYRNLFLPVYRRVERRLAASCKKLTVVSHSMADDYRRLYGVDSEVVWNGVDTDHFRPRIASQNSASIVFVGALKRGKGLLDLLAAARVVSRQQPDAHFLLYGEGPLRTKLEKEVRRNALQNFRLKGPVAHDDLPGVLASAATVVLPSYYEGLPSTLLEAMACGIPVVATEVKGNKEIVQDGVTGYLVPPQDPSVLAHAICRILEASEKGRGMGLDGRRLVEQKFTWKKRAEQFLNIYERVISAYGTGRSS